MLNSGIKKVLYRYGYPDDFSMKLFKEADVEAVQFNPDEVED